MTTFFAMGRLSATIVATVATIQPFAILIFERTLAVFFGKIYKDKITFLRMIYQNYTKLIRSKITEIFLDNLNFPMKNNFPKF